MSRADAEPGLEHVKSVLHEPDIMFGQFEACFFAQGHAIVDSAGRAQKQPELRAGGQGGWI